MDAHMQHLENLGGCMDDGYFEDEAEVMDRLDAALEQAWVLLHTTSVAQIRAPYQGEHGLEPNRDELGEL